MNLKRFVAPDNSFQLVLPAEWDTYDAEEPSTYGFFHSHSKTWTGNLRITPLRLTHPDSSVQRAASLVQEEWQHNEGAVKLSLGSYDCAHYRRDTMQAGESYVIYYWTMGAVNDLFICSFTIDKRLEDTPENSKTLETVVHILQSLIFL